MIQSANGVWLMASRPAKTSSTPQSTHAMNRRLLGSMTRLRYRGGARVRHAPATAHDELVVGLETAPCCPILVGQVRRIRLLDDPVGVFPARGEHGLLDQ